MLSIVILCSKIPPTILFSLFYIELCTQDEDKEDKSTRQKSNSNTDPKKNLGYTGQKQRETNKVE
jgi:hypothetical protein